MKIKVIVSAIGAATGYGIVRALEENLNVEVIGLNSKPMCPSSKFVKKFIISPDVYSDNYLEFVNNIIREEGASIFFPTLPPELKYVNDFCCYVAAPSLDLISLTLNKPKLYKFLNERNLNAIIPEYKVINSIDDFELFQENYCKRNAIFCLKEVAGFGSIGFKIIGNPQIVSEHFFKGQVSNWCTYSAISEILRNMPFIEGNMMVCEYLPGEEYSVDVFAIEGESKTIVTRKRTKIINGIVLDGEVIKKDILIKYTKEIVKSIGLDGFSNIQFKFDNEGIPKLIDFNPRFCGSQLISYGAGVNFPNLVINKLLGGEFEDSQIKWGTVSKRYWEMDFFYDDDINKN